jgi:hypothetical protein
VAAGHPVGAGSRFAGAQSFTLEFALVMVLRALWQWVGIHVRTHSTAAFEHAAKIQQLQAWLHLPNEVAIQHFVLPHHWLVWLLNGYYASVHLDGMLVFMIWVWWKHRDWFRMIRNTVAVTTLICLLLQTFPVAPPRLLPGGGFVDTALEYGQSVYGPFAAGLAAQLTAMPSLHIGWSFLVAFYLFRLGTGWLRWLGVADLVVTFFVIVATANHWWLDGAAGIAIDLLVITAQVFGHRAWSAWRGTDATTPWARPGEQPQEQPEPDLQPDPQPQRGSAVVLAAEPSPVQPAP